MSQYPDSNPSEYYRIVETEWTFTVEFVSPNFKVDLTIGEADTYKQARTLIQEDIELQDEAEAESQYDPDAAYERHLENAGSDEARMQEEIEASLGISQPGEMSDHDVCDSLGLYSPDNEGVAWL